MTLSVKFVPPIFYEFLKRSHPAMRGLLTMLLAIIKSYIQQVINLTALTHGSYLKLKRKPNKVLIAIIFY